MSAKKATVPYVSVVVISYNGEQTIAKTLDSLLAQTYPKDRMEIIVVDDGSTDRTAKIVADYPVRYIYQTNSGISAARNRGLSIVKGTIYVAFDDDCTVIEDWLQQLIAGYVSGKPVGIGGYSVHPKKLKGLAQNYISITGSGFPPISQGGRKPSFLKRLKNQFFPSKATTHSAKNDKVVVEELYGANASYPVSVLKEVGGWPLEFSGIEDRALSKTIIAAYPNHNFYAMRRAQIMHVPEISIWQYILRSYKRGSVTYRFYRSQHQILPIFPNPLIYLALLAASAQLNLFITASGAVLAPLILYRQWIREAMTTKNLWQLLFPYIQIAEQSAVIAGLVRGALHSIRTRKLFGYQLVQFKVIAGLVATNIWLSYDLSHNSGPQLAIISATYLLLLPGYFLQKCLLGRQQVRRLNAVTYSVGLSVLLLILIGLSVNQIGIVLGYEKPLTKLPIAYAIGAITTLLIIIAGFRSPPQARQPKIELKQIRACLPTFIVGLIIPILAAGGAITMNNGGSNVLAIISLLLLSLYFLKLVWKQRSGLDVYPYALYSICLALLLGTSLRGWNITGHDITQEFQVFQLTLHHSAWNIDYYKDAYNACLSITILPTILQRLTSVSDPFVFKAIFQFFFALIAPIMYSTIRRFTGRRAAFLAVFLFLTFPAFLTDITMLNRQETALLFLALSTQAALEYHLKRTIRNSLIFVFLVGMILSHYSTSYIAIGMLLLVLGLGFAVKIVRFLRRKPALRSAPYAANLYGGPVIISALIGLLLWGSVITKTSDNVSRTIHGLAQNLPHLIAQRPNLSAKSLSHMSDDVKLKEYIAATTKDRPLRPANYYSPATVAQSPVHIQPAIIAPETSIVKRTNIASTSLYSVYDFVRSSYGLIIEALLGLGVCLCIFQKRTNTKFPPQYILLIIASLALIGAQVVLPPPVINYGLYRLIQQSLLFLALPIILACLWLLKLIRLPTWFSLRLIAVSLVVFFLSLSGLMNALLGGYKPSLAFSNSGFYYDSYYTHQDEVSASRWITSQVPKGSRLYSDEFARRRLITYANIFGTPLLVPDVIPIDSYVYLNEANTSSNYVPVYIDGQLTYYSVPTKFLNSSKSIVYSTGSVVIYR